MKNLQEIADELIIARRFVECALMAGRNMPGENAAALAAVLFDASDKLKESINDLTDLCEAAAISSVRFRQ